jgi:hypothetical protein
LPSKLFLFRIENQRQAVFPGADDDNLCVLGSRKLLGGFDTFPSQQLLADPARNDVLEV